MAAQPIYFDQTTKFVGSMANKNNFTMDGDFSGKKNESGPDYSIYQTNIQNNTNDNTYQQDITKQRYEHKSGASEEKKIDASDDSAESLRSVNEMDEEAHEEYDNAP